MNYKQNNLQNSSLAPASYTLAGSYGFCYGVKKAVHKAYELAEALQTGQKCYMYGAVIHNKQVVNNLTANGFILVDKADAVAPGATVLIRAHGITGEELGRLRDKNCKVIDETCGYVRFIQNKIAKYHNAGYQIILAGHRGHPEIVSEISFAENNVIVVDSLTELKTLNLANLPTVLLAQTTFNHQEFTKISNFLTLHLEQLLIFDTICRATVDRQLATKELASTKDVMIVIGDRSSSNTKRLVDLSAEVCGETYLIESAADMAELKFKGVLAAKQVGVAASASAPDSIITEVIRIMNENTEVTKNQEALEETAKNQNAVDKQAAETGNDVSFSDFIDNIPQLKRGEIIKGVIVRYDPDFVYVDVKDKSEGKIPMSEFLKTPDFDLDKAIEDHQEIEIYVRSIRNTEMGKEILLSKARVDFNKYKELLKKAYEEKTPVTVKVVSKVKDGVIASYGGADIYIHRTQLELHAVEDLDKYVSQTLEILITAFDDSNSRRLRVTGSRRSLLAAIRDKQAEAIWDNLEVGDVYEGTVRNLTNFGAFVDLGGLDGLIHVTELSWKHIRHPKEVLKIGDKVQVYIKDFDRESKRISLGYRKLEDDPYFQIDEKYPVGSIVDGKVARIMPYGVFVNIAPGVDALCHISQICNRRIEKPEEVLKVGQEVQARVLEVNLERRRISISIKSVMNLGEPEGSALAISKKKEEQDFPSSYRDDDGKGADINIVKSND